MEDDGLKAFTYEPEFKIILQWMYIVPMVIFMMLQSAAQQPQQG